VLEDDGMTKTVRSGGGALATLQVAFSPKDGERSGWAISYEGELERRDDEPDQWPLDAFFSTVPFLKEERKARASGYVNVKAMVERMHALTFRCMKAPISVQTVHALETTDRRGFDNYLAGR
jgi:hypothetical protein